MSILLHKGQSPSVGNSEEARRKRQVLDWNRWNFLCGRQGICLCYHVGTGSRPCPLNYLTVSLFWFARRASCLGERLRRSLSIWARSRTRLQTQSRCAYRPLLPHCCCTRGFSCSLFEGKRFVASFVLCKTPGPPPDIHNKRMSKQVDYTLPRGTSKLGVTHQEGFLRASV
jgi:hypothetical protein